MKELDDFLARLRVAYPEVDISFSTSRKISSMQTTSTCKRPPPAAKSAKPVKMRQTLSPPSKNNNNNQARTQDFEKGGSEYRLAVRLRRRGGCGIRAKLYTMNDLECQIFMSNFYSNI